MTKPLDKKADDGSSLSETPSIQGKRILIIEDEALILMDLEYEIEDAGGVVAGECRSLAQALEAVKNTDFDAAILDVDLHGEDVFQVADRLIELNRPFVFHTGHATRYDLAGRYPGSPVCSKPIPGDKLLRVLAELIQ